MRFFSGRNDDKPSEKLFRDMTDDELEAYWDRHIADPETSVRYDWTQLAISILHERVRRLEARVSQQCKGS